MKIVVEVKTIEELTSVLEQLKATEIRFIVQDLEPTSAPRDKSSISIKDFLGS